MQYFNMVKRIIFVVFLLFFLAGCAGKSTVKVDFKGPASGPDPVKMQPAYGPND